MFQEDEQVRCSALTAVCSRRRLANGVRRSLRRPLIIKRTIFHFHEKKIPPLLPPPPSSRRRRKEKRRVPAADAQRVGAAGVVPRFPARVVDVNGKRVRAARAAFAAAALWFVAEVPPPGPEVPDRQEVVHEELVACAGPSPKVGRAARQRGRGDVAIPRMRRGGAAAATWTFRGDDPRATHTPARDVEIRSRPARASGTRGAT